MPCRFPPVAVLAALVALAACDSPSPGFGRGDKTVVEVGGSRFSVYRAGDRVQIIRTSTEWLPRREEILPRAEIAVIRATGCPVATGTLHGDPALMEARLDCDGSHEPSADGTQSRPQVYECDVVARYGIAGDFATVECSAG